METQTIRAIGKAHNIGRVLRRDYPEIAEDYEAGFTYQEIVEKYGLRGKYGATKRVAICSVFNAIHGRDEFLREKGYPGLIQDEERLERICRAHRRAVIANIPPEVMVRVGKESKKNKTGIFSLTKEQLRRQGEYFKIYSRIMGVGLFGMSHKEHCQAGTNAALSRGEVIWTSEERNYGYGLCLRPEYQVRLSIGGFKVKLTEVAEQINRVFHSGEKVRSHIAIGHMYKKMSRKKEKK